MKSIQRKNLFQYFLPDSINLEKEYLDDQEKNRSGHYFYYLEAILRLIELLHKDTCRYQDVISFITSKMDAVKQKAEQLLVFLRKLKPLNYMSLEEHENKVNSLEISHREFIIKQAQEQYAKMNERIVKEVDLEEKIEELENKIEKLESKLSSEREAAANEFTENYLKNNLFTTEPPEQKIELG